MIGAFLSDSSLFGLVTSYFDEGRSLVSLCSSFQFALIP